VGKNTNPNFFPTFSLFLIHSASGKQTREGRGGHGRRFYLPGAAGRGRATSSARARPARARPSTGAWTRHPSAAPVVVARGLWLARRDARGCPARGPGGAVARPAAGLARRRVARGCPAPGSRPRRCACAA